MVQTKVAGELVYALHACVLSHFSCVRLAVTLWTVAPPGSSPWDSPGKNTGVGYRALLHGIFPIQGLNPCLLSPALAGRFFTTSTTWETLDYALLFHHIFPAPNQDTWQEVMYLKETTEYGIFEITMVTENLGNLGDLTTASISILPDI